MVDEQLSDVTAVRPFARDTALHVAPLFELRKNGGDDVPESDGPLATQSVPPKHRMVDSVELPAGVATGTHVAPPSVETMAKAPF